MRDIKKLRITLQIAFFILFSGSFFFLTGYPTALTWPSDLFLKLNPLVGLGVLIASRKIILSLLIGYVIVAGLSLVFGRFFCGMVCPLGSSIDFFDRFLFKRMRKRDRQPPLYLQKLKYVFLIAVLLLAVFGVYFAPLTDPITILTRAFALVVNPLVSMLKSDALLLGRPLIAAVGAEDLAYATIKTPMYYGGFGVFLLMAFIFGSGIWDRRFWCQYVCPSGAFFGLLSRYSIFKRRVDASLCDTCKACTRRCPTHAIDEKEMKITSVAECTLCGDCGRAAKKDCTSFSFGPIMPEYTRGADLQRRHAVAGLVSGLFFLPVLRGNAYGKRDNTGRLVRPPGAVPESLFAARCLSCGACMKACPTNAIQPCSFSDGFQRVFTPKIVPRTGGCEEKCHVCGHACPTEAIRPLSYEEKRFVKIGTAVINRRRCLAWEQNKECLVCDEVCPYNAITPMIVETTTGPFKVPVVDEDLCLGCGMCEQHCPIFDQAAIEIFKFGENRRATGKYLSDRQKKQVMADRRKTDEAIGASLKPGAVHKEKADAVAPAQESAEPELPPGFTFD